MKRHNALTGLAAIALSIAALPGLAGPPVYEKSITVSYSDLDLTRAEGARTLYGRIRTAARRACSPEEYGIYSLRQNYRACVTEAVREAVGQVNQPTLTALHQARNSRAG
jgi:UrcA family protein